MDGEYEKISALELVELNKEINGDMQLQSKLLLKAHAKSLPLIERRYFAACMEFIEKWKNPTK